MNIKINSKEVKQGDIFIAIKGTNFDGHDYIQEAINNGAVKIVAEHGDYSVSTVLVQDTYKYLVNYLKKHYYNKIKSLKLIGITGTNGKTTSAYLLYQALNKLNIKTSYIGTIGFYMDDKVSDLDNTTPSILKIYEFLLKCVNRKFKYVVMEVSSHALSQNRCDSLMFDYAIFTNLTLDHLDYHETMEKYKNEKLKLFKKIKNNGKAIVNIDDQYSNCFLIKRNNNITFGRHDSDYCIRNVICSLNESKFDVIFNNQVSSYKTNLVGIYNIYNIMPVIIISHDLKFDYQDISFIILNLVTPPGRFEIIKYKENFIIIDYAHTPDGVLKVLKNVKTMSNGSIYTIIGCGGNRDKSKRPIMGQIATDNSDFVIFTADNPRFENAYNIVMDMIKKLNCSNYLVEIDRKNAIKKGIQRLTNNDILLVLGKGHEAYQIIGNVKHPFDDKKVVLDIIRR